MFIPSFKVSKVCPDATSARLAESPDGPKNDPELNPTAGNTQIQSRPGRLECQELRHVHGKSGLRLFGSSCGARGSGPDHKKKYRQRYGVATGKTRRATKPPTRASAHCSSRSLNRTTDRSDYAGGRGSARLLITPIKARQIQSEPLISSVITATATEHFRVIAHKC